MFFLHFSNIFIRIFNVQYACASIFFMIFARKYKFIKNQFKIDFYLYALVKMSKVIEIMIQNIEYLFKEK